MKKQDLLDEALSRGILTNDQRRQLAELEQDEVRDNEERIKPIGTMNEIFVTFGVILLTGAMGGLIGMVLRPFFADKGNLQLFVTSSIISAGATWMVALWFHRRKRFRLPIIYCVLSVAMGLTFTIFYGLNGSISHDLFDQGVPLATVVAALLTGMGVLAVGAARFRIPFLMLPIAILFTITVTYVARHGEADASWRLLLGGCGLVILAVAILFDLKDPKRVTRWSDFAFWSYVVGSPLFVHSLFLSVIVREEMKEWFTNPVLWMSTAALTIAVTFVGLLLNRRALILSTLIYVSFVIMRILTGLLMGTPVIMLLLTTLIMGLYVTTLGSRWTRVRNAFMSSLPPSWKWVDRLPAYDRKPAA